LVVVGPDLKLEMPDPPALQLENDHPGPAAFWEGFSLFPIVLHGNVAISGVTLLGRVGQPK
jgi:hypothetical protein